MADVKRPLPPIPDASTVDDAESASFLGGLVAEILGSYTNIALVIVIGVLLYKILRSRSSSGDGSAHVPEPELPKLRRDFTIQELKQFDGNQPDGRVLMAVKGTVYDVTKGKRFYGPGESGRDSFRV